VSVAALFVGGFIPALVLAIAIMAYIYWDDAAPGHRAVAAHDGGGALAGVRGALIPLGCRSSSSAASWAA